MGLRYGLEVSHAPTRRRDKESIFSHVDESNSYALQWLVVLPLEIIAASITLSYWNSNINKAIFVTIFLVFVVIINFFGVKGYGEAEFVFAIVKVIAVIGFMLVFFVLSPSPHP